MTPEYRALTAWGDIKVLGTLKGGARSALVKIEIGDIRAVARKTRDTDPSIRWLASVCAIAERCGLICPRPLPSGTGAMVAGGWRVETFVSGIPASGKDMDRTLPLVKRLHAATRGRIGQRPGHPPMAARNSAAPVNLARACRAEFPRRGRAAVHGDLHQGNLLVTDGGRLAFLDWDEARLDHPGFDLNVLGKRPSPNLHAAYETEACWRDEPARARQMSKLLLRLTRRPSGGSVLRP
ncbi:MAG: aminoglycoside phosphotransferase family protein [Pseudomonadota bacterium]